MWDTVADRLFKIRNCQNIDGVERQLALFAPPIDPAALIRATSMGLSTPFWSVRTSVPLNAVMLKFAVCAAGTNVPSDWALRTAVPLVGGFPSNENCDQAG